MSGFFCWIFALRHEKMRHNSEHMNPSHPIFLLSPLTKHPPWHPGLARAIALTSSEKWLKAVSVAWVCLRCPLQAWMSHCMHQNTSTVLRGGSHLLPPQKGRQQGLLGPGSPGSSGSTPHPKFILYRDPGTRCS